MATAPTLWYLLLCVAASAGGWWFLRHRRGNADGAQGFRGRRDGGVTRLSSQALTPQASVHAIRWNGDEFLLACTSQQVTLIDRKAADQRNGNPHEPTRH